ncbi:MAG TPA: hypothetical protein VHO93_11950 [Actinomycetota bacterium]|jgi:hypothetical protein|nr:hypothetical protein [Actinomycetota bacterium]
MPHRYPPPPKLEELGLAPPGPGPGGRRSGDDLPKMKRFRSQLLAGWIAERFPPCVVADVGGGKGLLTWLLIEAGFQAEVVDPVDQPLPATYRDLRTGRRVRLGPGAAVPRRRVAFGPGLGRRYDLLVALHAHGSNLAVLDTAAAAGSSCVVLPCCVVDEPGAPGPGQNWFLWLVEHARGLGLQPEFFALNFRGQRLGFVVRGQRPAS